MSKKKYISEIKYIKENQPGYKTFEDFIDWLELRNHNYGSCGNIGFSINVKKRGITPYYDLNIKIMTDEEFNKI